MATKYLNVLESTGYKELYKIIKKRLREEFREHNAIRVQGTIRWELKKVKEKEGRKDIILTLQEHDEIFTINREKLLERGSQ